MRHYTHVLGISTSENTSIYALPRGSSFACQQQVVPESSRFALFVHGRIRPSQNGRFVRFLLPHPHLGDLNKRVQQPQRRSKEVHFERYRKLRAASSWPSRGGQPSKEEATHNHEDHNQ